MRAPLVIELIAGSRVEREPAAPASVGLTIMQNGPPGTCIRFADESSVPLPTDQIVHADDDDGFARVGFGGMEFRGLHDGALVFVRVLDLRPPEMLSPERGLRMTLAPSMVTAVIVDGVRVWPS